MNRRTVLKWLSAALGAVACAFVAIPAVGYFAEFIRRRPANRALVQRVIRLRDLPPGRAKMVPIIGSRLDAWTLYPAETVGRVWLVRETDDSVEEAAAKVVAFTSVCPHLGCQIQLDARGEKFVCLCHRAAFNFDGSPVSEQELGHRIHAPRPMDTLDCVVVRDESSGEWWVEVKYQRFVQGLTRRVVKT